MIFDFFYFPGYPLEYLPLPTPHKYKLCKMPTACVQQGVVNGDPDLDATYRLTRKNHAKPIDIYFDLKAPTVVLPKVWIFYLRLSGQ